MSNLPASPPAPAKKGGGLIWTGAILLVLGLVGGGALAIFGTVRLASQFDRQVDVPGSATFTLEPGDYGVYLLANSSFTTSPEVTITDPSGNDVPLRRGDANFTGNSGGDAVRSVNEFTAPTAGAYTVTAEVAGDIQRQPLSPQSVAIAPTAGQLVGTVFGLVFGGLCGGGLIFVLGLVLLIVGLVSRSRSKKRAAAAYGGYGPGPGGPPAGYPSPSGPPPAPGAVAGGPGVPPPAPGVAGPPPAPGAPPPAPGAAPPADPWNR